MIREYKVKTSGKMFAQHSQTPGAAFNLTIQRP